MTAFELCGETDFSGRFTVGNSKIVWESCCYRNCDKVIISRLVTEGGKPFMLGLRYKQRYIKPETIIKIQPCLQNT